MNHGEDRFRDPRPISSVIEDTLINIQEIIRSEVRLASAEIRERFEIACRPAGMLAIAVLAGLYAIGFLLLSAVYGLSKVLDPWLAALIVGGSLLTVAAALALQAWKGFRKISAPKKTIQSVKENVTWLKDQIR